MKRKFTFLIAAAVMLLTMMATTVEMWGQAAVNTTLWEETWTGGAANTTPSSYSFSGTTVYGDATLTYVQSSNNTKLYDATLAGGTTPELLLSQNNQTWTIGNIPTGQATEMSLTFLSNKTTFAVTSTTTGITISGSGKSWTISATSTVSSFNLTIKNTGSSNARIDNILLKVTTAGGGSDPTITLSDSGTGNIGNYAVNTEITRDFTVTQSNLTAPISLSATNGGAFTINNEPATSIPAGDGSTEVTWHFTPTAAGQFTSKITATSGETSSTCTYLGYAYEVHNVNIAQMEHGTVSANPESTFYWELVSLTVTPDYGYELEELTVVDANNNPVTVTNNSFHMPDSDVTVSATFVQASPTTTVTDVLNYVFTGISGSSYQSWSDKTGTSGAVYAGNSNAGVTYIQLRSTSPSGIVSTTSAGKVKKVTVIWNSSTIADRTLNVYGKNTAYEGSSDLYGSNAGTLLGTIVKGTSTELTVTGDYAYVGLRSASGAMYLDEIDIVWATSGTPTCAAPTFTPAAGAVLSGTTVAISTTTDGATIYYTMGANPDDPTTSSSVYSTPIEITEATTIKAMAVKDGYNNSTISSAAYTVVTPYTTIPAIFAKATEVGSTQTNIYVSFNDWIVVGKYSSHAYVSDGQYGLHLFKSGGTGFEVGDKLSGTVATKVQLYTGGAELVDLTSSTPELTVTHNQSFEPYAISLADVFGQGIYYGSYVDLGNLTYTNGSKFSDGNGHEITPNNSLNITGYPTLEAGKTYHVKGVYIQYNSTTKHIAPVYASDFTEYSGPSITLTPAAANPFTYVEGQGPSVQQDFTVALENETSKNVTATITTGTDYFEIKNGENWASATTINIDNTNTISVRMKAGLALGNNYAGVLTLTNDGAENVTVNLSGSVTGATYTINLDDQVVGGTIEADKTSAAEGETVTLTAHPDAAYTFGSWTVYQDDLSTEVTVTDDQFTMPACEVYVTATFNAKPTYAVTCVVSLDEGGEMEATPTSAYEGQTVTLSYLAETGYILSGIVITKTEDGSATGITPTASGDDFTFTMPGYAVTATATFLSETYTGSFVKFTGDAMEEGDYIFVFDGKAMNNDNSTTSDKLGATDVVATGNIITDPSRSIVWHIAPIGTDGKWTIYNAYVSKYVNASASNNTKITLVDNASYSNGAKWSITIDEENNTYDFSSLTTSRALRYYESSDVFGHYATSNGGPFTLYKYTELTERTITFNGNGGLYQGNETYTQTVYDGIAANLTANQFAKANSAFSGWSTTQNGEVEYADGASITVTGNDITLFAQWSTSYTAMADDPIVGGAVLINGEEIVEVAEGTQMTLTYTANPGYAFGAWNVYKADDPTTTVAVENNQFNMPAYDVIVSASFVEVTTYSLVTNVNQIVSGKHYILVGYKSSTEKYYAMGYDRGNNRAAVEVSVEETVYGNYIEQTADVYEFVINTHLNSNNEIEYYTIYDAVTPGYLYAASSGSNYLKTQTTNDANGQWTISIEDNKATILAQGSYSHNKMRFNDSNNPLIFACYLPTNTTGSLPYIYVKDNDNDYEYYGMEITYNEPNIPDGETLTVGAGSVMTVSDNFVNNYPEALVIQEGGQLIHESDVQATVQKSVAAYTAKDGDGWYLIASPVDNYSTSTIATGTYDLFIYNEPNAYWYSSTGAAAPFNTLERGKGYLYANEANVNLNYAGTMKATDANIKVDLSYACDEYPYLKGFNLVGNPFTRNLTATDMVFGGTNVVSYYDFNADRTEFVTYQINERPIQPGQGFFIQATASEQKLVFNPTTPPTKDASDFKYISISAGDENFTDKAYIQFGYGNTLRKMTFGENTMVYVMNDDLDYAAARVEELAGTIPVHFVPIADGFYTITVETKNIENLNYMHLIDNITNTDIDLLAESSYTFKASESDNADRFHLVFDFNNYTGVNENYTNDNFAHQIGDEIFVSGEGTLQVFDVLGRFVTGYNVNGDKRISTAEFNTGVYIFRMVGTEVKTQKIVIR